MLEIMYEQCNNHLRDLDKKRDQALFFYGVIVGTLTFYVPESSLNGLNSVGIFIAVYLFSLGIAFVTLNYMKWHTIYITSAKALQFLMNMPLGKYEQAVVNEKYYQACQDSECDFKTFMKRSETWLFILYIAFSFFFLLIHMVRMALELTCAIRCLAYIVVMIYPVGLFWLSYVFFRGLLMAKMVKGSKKPVHWILSVSPNEKLD